VAAANRRDVPIHLLGLGNVQAYNTVTVRPQVDGQLVQIAFTEGQMVKAGEVLARIDPRSFQATLDQALARKAQDEAQLANARVDLQRYAGLVAHQYSSQQQYDTTRAQVAQLEAAVQGDQAAAESARIQLGYTAITAPLDGRAGIRLVDQGNIVHASDAGGIVTVTQLRPISVIFTLPEEVVPRLLKTMASAPPPVAVLSRDSKETLDRGQLTLLDNQIDPATGTIRLKATLPNQAGLLWPGQFVNVQVLIETRPQALTVPATAVLRGQKGAYTYVVQADGTVEVRSLTVGPIAAGVAVIEDGLHEGETVVTAGQYRLQPGARVEVRPPQAAATRSGQAG
jgi:multidrug efflux system membrane fusion protein